MADPPRHAHGVVGRGRVQYDRRQLKHRSGTMAESNDSTRRTHPGTTRAAPDLSVEGLPRWTIHATNDGTWHVTAQLAIDAQAALAAAAPTSDDLCRLAQHALGLAGIGSHIDRAHGAVGIATDRSGAGLGAPTLILDGPAVLWWVAYATSAAIQALVDAVILAMRTAPDS
jgi:hypothetical protein